MLRDRFRRDVSDVSFNVVIALVVFPVGDLSKPIPLASEHTLTANRLERKAHAPYPGKQVYEPKRSSNASPPIEWPGRILRTAISVPSGPPSIRILLFQPDIGSSRVLIELVFACPGFESTAADSEIIRNWAHSAHIPILPERIAKFKDNSLEKRRNVENLYAKRTLSDRTWVIRLIIREVEQECRSDNRISPAPPETFRKIICDPHSFGRWPEACSTATNGIRTDVGVPQRSLSDSVIKVKLVVSEGSQSLPSSHGISPMEGLSPRRP